MLTHRVFWLSRPVPSLPPQQNCQDVSWQVQPGIFCPLINCLSTHRVISPVVLLRFAYIWCWNPKGMLGPSKSISTITKQNCQLSPPGYRSLASAAFCHSPYLTPHLEFISSAAFLLYLLYPPISPSSWSCLLSLSLLIQQKSCWYVRQLPHRLWTLHHMDERCLFTVIWASLWLVLVP